MFEQYSNLFAERDSFFFNNRNIAVVLLHLHIQTITIQYYTVVKSTANCYINLSLCLFLLIEVAAQFFHHYGEQ